MNNQIAELKALIAQRDESITIQTEIILNLKAENERLKEENEKLKEYIKDLQIRKDRYFLQVLEYEKQISDWITFYIKIRDVILGNCEILDSLVLQEIRQIIKEQTNE